MKYILIKEKDIIKIYNTELCINTYLLKLKKYTIRINFTKIIDKIVLNELFKNINPTLNKILYYLTSEDDNEEETSKLYDELAKQRSIILKKYDKYLSLKAQEEYLKKIRFLALELQKRLISYKYVEEKLKQK